MTTNVARLNELELEKLHLTADYVTVMLKLEAELESVRLCLSKTKAIVGFSNASASLIDLRDMEPIVKICIDKNDKFVLESNNDDEMKSKVVNRKKKVEEVEKKQKPTLKNYKPFGEFEPQTAKQARKLTENAILLTFELATIQKKLLQLKK